MLILMGVGALFVSCIALKFLPSSPKFLSLNLNIINGLKYLLNMLLLNGENLYNVGLQS